MTYFKSFIVNKIDKIKNVQTMYSDSCHIDINSWFRSNSLNPSNMNEVRQFIFEEWLHKKIAGTKNKISSGSALIIVYDSPTDLFIDLLKQKITDVFECEFCEIVLIDE